MKSAMVGERARLEPIRSRLLVVSGAVVFAALVGLQVWLPGGDDWRPLWRFVATPMTFGVTVIGMARLFRRPEPPALVVTRDGVAVRHRLYPAALFVVALLACVLLAGPVVDAWRDAVAPSDRIIAVSYTAVTGVLVGLLTLLIPSAWHGYAIELTPAGVRTRAPFHRRLIPWPALAPGGPPRPPWNSTSVMLVVTEPDLGVQRGRDMWFGTRDRPVLPVDAETRVIADAVRWYAEHPECRPAIGTEEEFDRLCAAIADGATTEPAPLVPPAPPAAVPLRLRHPRLAMVLVHLTYVVATLIAAVTLVLIFAQQDQLLAAERASAVYLGMPADGTVGFSTGTVGFVQRWTIGLLLSSILVGVLASLLLRAVRRGSSDARIGLGFVLGATAVVNLCPCFWLSTSLMGEPAAGLLLNGWNEAAGPLGLLTGALAAASLVAVLTTDRRS